MSASLPGKSVVVTGGSKDIGKGIARVFAGHDAKVLIVARQGKEAEGAAQELSKGGATVGAFAADVTRLPDMEAMAAAAVDRHGGLDMRRNRWRPWPPRETGYPGRPVRGHVDFPALHSTHKETGS